MTQPLHADTVAVLSGWSPPDPAAATARQQTLELLAAGPVTVTRRHWPGHVSGPSSRTPAAPRAHPRRNAAPPASARPAR